MPDRRYSSFRQLGLLASIPALMIVAPLIGLFGGQWVDRKLHTEPWGIGLGVGLGFFAAAREIRGILRKVNSQSDGKPGGPKP